MTAKVRKYAASWVLLVHDSAKTYVRKRDPYLDLAGAILKQAVDDYIEAYKEADTRTINQLEKFFLSEWGQRLSYDQGEFIIKHAQRIATGEEQIHRRNLKHW